MTKISKIISILSFVVLGLNALCGLYLMTMFLLSLFGVSILGLSELIVTISIVSVDTVFACMLLILWWIKKAKK